MPIGPSACFVVGVTVFLGLASSITPVGCAGITCVAVSTVVVVVVVVPSALVTVLSVDWAAAKPTVARRADAARAVMDLCIGDMVWTPGSWGRDRRLVRMPSGAFASSGWQDG